MFWVYDCPKNIFNQILPLILMCLKIEMFCVEFKKPDAVTLQQKTGLNLYLYLTFSLFHTRFCTPPKIYLYFKRADCRDLQTMLTNRLNVFLQKIFIYETCRRFIKKKMIIKQFQNFFLALRNNLINRKELICHEQQFF